jgi:hypothetical protein
MFQSHGLRRVLVHEFWKVVMHNRAAMAATLRCFIEHGMVNYELSATLEEVNELDLLAFKVFEGVVFLDLDHGELLTGFSQRCASISELFLLLEELNTGSQPFVASYDVAGLGVKGSLDVGGSHCKSRFESFWVK